MRFQNQSRRSIWMMRLQWLLHIVVWMESMREEVQSFQIHPPFHSSVQSFSSSKCTTTNRKQASTTSLKRLQHYYYSPQARRCLLLLESKEGISDDGDNEDNEDDDIIDDNEDKNEEQDEDADDSFKHQFEKQLTEFGKQSEEDEFLPSLRKAREALEAKDSNDDNDAATTTMTTTSTDMGYSSTTTTRDDVFERERDPSRALFRIMTKGTPNQAINKFVSTADPQIVSAMSGAVSNLLGGLCSPNIGMETIIKATADKIGNLCFQLQMTGYLFRNVEYVMALKDLMNIKSKSTITEYRMAFDRVDKDKSGYIDIDEIEELLASVYQEDEVPRFEVESFLAFFDSNRDGKISWLEFEKGFNSLEDGNRRREFAKRGGFLLAQGQNDDDEDDAVATELSGVVEIELEDGRVVQVEAAQYLASLKKEAQALKEALRPKGGQKAAAQAAYGPSDLGESLATYMESRQEVERLTAGISPEILATMKMLVEHVMDGGGSDGIDSGDQYYYDEDGIPRKLRREEMEMEIPGAAFQQLALWQLVLGYRLREAEAKGEYLDYVLR